MHCRSGSFAPAKSPGKLYRPGSSRISMHAASHLSGLGLTSGNMNVTAHGAAPVSPHSDALRRRKEAEERARQREAELMRARDLESAGLKWWQGSMPDNMVVLANPEQFVDFLEIHKSKLAIVNFFTEECYVCKTFYQKLKKIAADNPDVMFAKVNGSELQLRGLFDKLQITKVPLFQFYRNGVCVSQLTASLNPEKLAMFRAEIAAHKVSTFADADNPAYTSLEK
eukprot:CAMPEP_0202891400 /NCGR_PEP_ID=MMETSP1392-20130828/1463_1 /ASSEMBLY_ACC=CAM_ASM_000868 /TAXON_ID=225041 /ORGANISM="Chlamydomonas chlamydogama, Strain SAG 11-48b" /LENGTH=225 /DNA_ID=CAMNT_0049575139 /DNA_START=158 /DNA_END=835 /DNA_ORIENTATION=+